MCIGQLYAVQQGISLAKGNESAKAYLVQLMDQLQDVCGTTPIISSTTPILLISCDN